VGKTITKADVVAYLKGWWDQWQVEMELMRQEDLRLGCPLVAKWAERGKYSAWYAMSKRISDMGVDIDRLGPDEVEIPDEEEADGRSEPEAGEG